jgi:hypothetical protein
MDTKPLHFIDEPITVEFDQPPVLEKKPPCPARFVWRGDAYTVTALLHEWMDTTRRGRNARNMRPAHLIAAASRGSWGVGRQHFRVRTESRRVFDLYYDREPKGSDDRKGHWVLFRELAE